MDLLFSYLIYSHTLNMNTIFTLFFIHKFIYKKSDDEELEFISSILKPRKSKFDLMDEHLKNITNRK